MANTVKNKKVAPVRIIILGAVAALIVIIAVVSVFLTKEEAPTDLRAPLLTVGNSGGNLTNGGSAVEAGGSVFLSDAVTGEILKVAPGQTTGTSLGIRGKYINTDGTSLWYVDQDTGYLMKTDLNGTSPTAVLSVRVTRPVLAGEYIYYIDVDSNYALSRMALIGGATELLSDARVQQYAIVGRKIFYRNLNGADCASYMNLDGSGAAELPSIRFTQILFSHGYRLYYSNAERGGAIDYMELGSNNYFTPLASTDAALASTVNTGTITAAVADDQALYYVKASDGCLYKRGLSTADPAAAAEVRLTDYPVYGLQDAGGYIYVQSVSEGGVFRAIAKQ